MSSIPLLDDGEDQIRQSLSIEEIRIALTFLKKRFRDYTLKEIVQALSEYLTQKQTSALSVAITRGSSKAVSRIPQGLFLHHRQQPLCREDRSLKSQQIRLVAKLYCQSGINYSLAHYFYPQMTSKNYKSDLQLIAAQTVNCIQKFLRYQCNVQIQQLSQLQKRSIRQRLINVRQWMGKTHPENLKTYLLFIERYYLNEAIEIEYKEALELYKVILNSVKGPEVVAQEGDAQTNRALSQELRLAEVNQGSCSKDQENALILLFKQLCSIQKVSDAMCQKYGYDIKWSIHSIKNILKRIYKVSLKKLAETAHLYLKKPVNLWFGYGDEDVNTLIEYQNSLETKILLLDFYLLKKTTQLKIRQFVKKVNEFYLKNYQQVDVMDCIPEEIVRLPTLVIEDKPVETIEIIDQRGEDNIKRQFNRQPNEGKMQINKKRKNLRWKQVIQLQQSANEDEIFIFPRAESFKEKEAQEETDIEDKFVGGEREKNIFKPQLKLHKKDDIESKVSKDQKDNKDSKIPSKNPQVKQQMPIQQQQAKVQKLKFPKQSAGSETWLEVIKNKKLNRSTDSIESEPVRVSLYNKLGVKKSGRFEQKFGGRFKRKTIQQDEDKMQLQN